MWGVLIIGGVVPFLAFFMLCSKNQVATRMDALFSSRIDTTRFITSLNQMIRGFVAGNLIVGSVMAVATTLMLMSLGVKGAIPLGIVSGLLNLLPFLGLILSLTLPLAAALLQFSTPGPYIIITLTILLLHVLSANLLIPKFIATRVSIGPVAATVGILFWGWLWGVMGLLLAVPLTALRQTYRGFASVLMSLIQHVGADAASDATLGALWRNDCGADDPLLARSSRESSIGVNRSSR